MSVFLVQPSRNGNGGQFTLNNTESSENQAKITLKGSSYPEKTVLPSFSSSTLTFNLHQKSVSAIALVAIV